MHADVPAPSGALLRPGLAAIGGLVESVGRRRIQCRGHGGIDDEVVESHADERRCRQYRPAAAAVGRQIDAGAEVGVEVSFTAAGIDTAGVGWIERHSADRKRRHRVGARRPVGAGILAFPYAAARGADKQMLCIARVHRDTRYAADHVNTVGAVGLPVGDMIRSQRLPQCGCRARRCHRRARPPTCRGRTLQRRRSF